MKQLTLGSLFSGSGGFELAGVLHGIRPVWASEIEPFPIRVTQLRFPEMKHLGSVTDINGAEIEPVDIITFGSPCQDLSIAGDRLGIHKGERSSLFFEAIRIIKEMRHATNNQYPKYAVWENVKGAFSSNSGADFRAVLQSLCDAGGCTDTVPLPPKGRWLHAGCIVGDGFSIAWRLYDAQHWGVPQRRERIYLIADFGSECAGEILFKPEGCTGDSDQSGAPWEVFATGHAGSTGRSDCIPLNVLAGTSSRSNITDGQICPTLMARMGTGGGNIPMVFTVYDARGNGNGQIIPTITGDHNNRVTDYTAICIGNGKHRKYIVRRLTPVECARLQGFPDWWCDGADGSDTAQYLLWGNGISLPCAADVLGKIATQESA